MGPLSIVYFLLFDNLQMLPLLIYCRLSRLLSQSYNLNKIFLVVPMAAPLSYFLRHTNQPHPKPRKDYHRKSLPVLFHPSDRKQL